MLTRTGRAVVATAAAMLSGLLVGCGGSDGISVGTPEGSVKIDSNDGEFSAEGSDGTKVEGGARIPDDFPVEVPLVDGTVIQGVSMSSADGGGFTISIELEADVNSVFEDAKARLEDAGFTAAGTQSAGGVMMGSFTSDAWATQVTVSPSGDEGKVFATYIVAAPTG